MYFVNFMNSSIYVKYFSEFYELPGDWFWNKIYGYHMNNDNNKN